MGLLWILSVFPALLYGDVPNPAVLLTGRWTGEARIVNNFTDSPRLPVALRISPDGAVTGRVGEAQIVDGRIQPRRWWQFRAFNHYELRIDFNLSGALTSDGVTRKTGSIVLSQKGELLNGWFFSTGDVSFPWQSRETLRRTMQIHATDLYLRRL